MKTTLTHPLSPLYPWLLTWLSIISFLLRSGWFLSSNVLNPKLLPFPLFYHFHFTRWSFALILPFPFIKVSLEGRVLLSAGWVADSKMNLSSCQDKGMFGVLVRGWAPSTTLWTGCCGSGTGHGRVSPSAFSSLLHILQNPDLWHAVSLGLDQCYCSHQRLVPRLAKCQSLLGFDPSLSPKCCLHDLFVILPLIPLSPFVPKANQFPPSYFHPCSQ